MGGQGALTRRVLLGGWNLMPRLDRVAVTLNEDAADTRGMKHRSLEDRALLEKGPTAHPVLVRRLPRRAVTEAGSRPGFERDGA